MDNKEKTVKITLTMTLSQAENLHGLIDGSMGTSFDEGFTEEFKPIRNRLAKLINKHRPNPKNHC